jgi:hypothetical protein
MAEVIQFLIICTHGASGETNLVYPKPVALRIQHKIAERPAVSTLI